PERSDYLPFAGMSSFGGSNSLQQVRDAYGALFRYSANPYPSGLLNWPDSTINELRDLIRRTTVIAAEMDEFELLRCKVELRAGKLGDEAALAQAGSCFDNYLSRSRPEAFASEARGWRARTLFLRGKGASAAKFYLDELAKETSNIRRERLLD